LDLKIFINKNVHISSWCVRQVSTFIRYALSQKIRKPNISKVFGSKKSLKNPRDNRNP